MEKHNLLPAHVGGNFSLAQAKLFIGEEALTSKLENALTTHLKVEMMPILRRRQIETTLNLEMPDASTVEDLLSKLGFSDEEMHGLMISIDNKLVHLREILKENDTVWVGTAIGGG